MTTSQPPSYEEALAQMKKIQAEGIPDHLRDAAEEAMTKKLSEPETKQQIVDEVKLLADGAVKIDQAFQRVSAGLGQFDNNSLGIFPKLRPTWDGFHQRYLKLLWGSYKTARETETYLQDFIDGVLPSVQDAAKNPEDESKLQAAKDKITEFLERTNPNQGIVDGANAEGHSQGFTELSRTIKEFKGNFDKFIDSLGTGIAPELQRLKGEIVVLQVEVARIDTIISGLAISLGVTAFGTIVGATAALAATGPFAPFALAAVLIVGIGAAIGESAALVAYTKQRNELRATIDEKQSEIKQLQDKLEFLQGIQAELHAYDQEIDYIVARLDQFAHIWSMVAHDAGAIRQILNDMKGSATSRALSRRLELLQHTYTPLKEALSLYANTIDQSGVTKLDQ